MAPEPARLEHPTGGQLVVRILEHAAVRALVRRLGRLAPRLQIGDEHLDLFRWAWRQAELDLRHHLSRSQAGAPVLEPELLPSMPAGAFGVDDEGALEDARPVAVIGAGVHADAASRGPGDRARELEPS